MSDEESNGLIEIRDIGLLAMLRMFKIKPKKTRMVQIHSMERAVFLFDSVDLGNTVNDYFERKAMVEARTFAATLKEIKSEIYDLKHNINLGGDNNGTGSISQRS